MNSINKFFRIGFLVLMLSSGFISCTKFLERPPPDLIISDSAINDDNSLQQLINGTIRNLGEGQTFGGRFTILPELMADQLDGVLLTEDYGEIFGRRTSVFGNFKNDSYTNTYYLISNANVVLRYLDVAPEPLKSRYEGMAKFIRGMLHFELVRLFAQPYGFTADNSHLGIPIRLTPSYQSENRATVAQVYAQIISDLEDAAELLPETNGAYPTRHAARAYLAKVYFQMNNFQQAFNYAGQVIGAASANTYQFNTSANEYNLRFSVAGTREAIFRILTEQNVFDPGGELRGNFRSDVAGNPTLHFTDAVYNRFQNTNDARAAWLSNTLKENINVLTKYNADRFQLPIITISEIILIRAEAGAELGGANLATAITDINLIRSRAYGGTNLIASNALASEVITAARNERNLEFIGEGKRLHEIKRIGARNNTNIDARGARWNCPGLILQFPQGEMAANTSFQRNPEGGCN